jgi:hypothetical protein
MTTMNLWEVTKVWIPFRVVVVAFGIHKSAKQATNGIAQSRHHQMISP